MKKLITTALILGISITSAIVFAGDRENHHGKRGAKHFSLIDTNKDDFLSREEVIDFHNQRFTNIDADNDEFISKEEIHAYRQKKHLTKMDTNNNGLISESEREKAKQCNGFYKNH